MKGGEENQTNLNVSFAFAKTHRFTHHYESVILIAYSNDIPHLI
jgi:hypothetical protein